MEVLKEILPLILGASLFTLVLAVGLDSEPGDLVSVLRSPGRLFKAILAVNVAVPLAAIVLLKLIPIGLPAAAAVLLMSVSPAPPLVPGKQLKVGGERSYAYGLYAAMILLSVVVVPLSLMVLERIYGVELALPPLAIAQSVATTAVLPLLLGVAARRLIPGLPSWLSARLRTIAMLMLVLAAIPLLVRAWGVFAPMMGDGTVIVMLLVVAAALAAGHLLGGPDPNDRAVLAVTAATRHPGIAVLIAKSVEIDPRIPAAVLGFMIIGIFAGLPYQTIVKRRLKGAAAS